MSYKTQKEVISFQSAAVMSQVEYVPVLDLAFKKYTDQIKQNDIDFLYGKILGWAPGKHFLNIRPVEQDN